MKGVKLNPKDINQPIQLLGASLIGAVLLVGEFLYSSMNANIVMGWFYAITAILIFPTILIFIFKLQTKYRKEIQSDPYYYRSKQRDYEEQENRMEKVEVDLIKKWLKK